MKNPNGPRARRVSVAASEPAIGRYDYADAFEIRVREPDPRSPEQLARCALEQAAWPVRATIWIAQRQLLRFRLARGSSADHVQGWRIVASGPELIHLEAVSPLVHGAIVGRKVDPTCARVTTYLSYKRRVPAGLLWKVAGPLHRRIAPYLIERAAAART